MTGILVGLSEEYGYRNYVFTFPGTMEELKAKWLAQTGNNTAYCAEGVIDQLGGVDAEPVEERIMDTSWFEYLETFAQGLRPSQMAFIHTHTPADSYLVIGDSGKSIDHPQQLLHVLYDIEMEEQCSLPDCQDEGRWLREKNGIAPNEDIKPLIAAERERLGQPVI